MRGAVAITTQQRPRRPQGRPPRSDVPRPPCPLGHEGRIHLDGHHKSRRGDTERARYRCIPYDEKTKPHAFRPPVRHRHPVGSGAHACATCERRLRREDGPTVVANFEFAIREIAYVLVRLGQGESYRKVAVDLRTDLGKTQRSSADFSPEGNICADYVDTLADVVIEEIRESSWPELLVIDSLPFRKRVLDRPVRKRINLPWPAGVKRKPRRPRRAIQLSRKVDSRGRGAVLAAVGKSPAERDWRPILVRFAGGEDESSWLDFFRSLPGTPSYVVSDRSTAIIAAVKRAWPDAPPVHHFCHDHFTKNAADAAEKAGEIEQDDPFRDEIAGILLSDEHYEDVIRRATEIGAPMLADWLVERRPIAQELRQQQEAFPDHPRSTGPVEAMIRRTKLRLMDRVHLFHNAARLDRLLALMTADYANRASEASYTRILRDWFSAHGGVRAAADWERLRDRKGTSSVEELIRTASKRAEANERSKMATRQATTRAPGKVRIARRRQALGKIPPPPAVRTKNIRGKRVSDFPRGREAMARGEEWVGSSGRRPSWDRSDLLVDLRPGSPTRVEGADRLTLPRGSLPLLRGTQCATGGFLRRTLPGDRRRMAPEEERPQSLHLRAELSGRGLVAVPRGRDACLSRAHQLSLRVQDRLPSVRRQGPSAEGLQDGQAGRHRGTRAS
jgi:hypothetical protein